MEGGDKQSDGKAPKIKGTSSAEYKVGYCKPPLHTRFQKGGSGNPGGRPRASRNFKTDFLDEMGEQILVTEGGKRRPLSKQRITVKTLIGLGMKGDVRALQKVIDLALKLEPQDDQETRDAVISEADQEILAAFLARHSGTE